MPGTSLFTLIDDIASILDDVAAMSKVAAKKTVGVLGDDLALNAQQVAGVNADRELPVVWAVAVGSLKNKAVLVPTALAVRALIPWAITPLLMMGGAFLCYEGFEKIAHKFLPPEKESKAQHDERADALANPAVDMVAFEKEKVRGAIRTDFILSAEIIVITLGTVTAAPLGEQAAVLTAIAAIMTVGVYGFVAGIVKLDDFGLFLNGKTGRVQQSIGRTVLTLAPFLMKGLSIAGTAAMFMVGGGILIHGIPLAQKPIQNLTHSVGAIPGVGWLIEMSAPSFANAFAGVVAGAIVLGAVKVAERTVAAAKG